MAKAKTKLSRQNIDCMLYCMKCDAFACVSQDIRKVEGTHHVVVSIDFKLRYKFDPMPKPKVLLVNCSVGCMYSATVPVQKENMG